MINLTRNEIIVLQILKRNGCVNMIKSSTIKKISEESPVSYFTVRNVLKSFILAKICGFGCKSGQADTYYITEKGLQLLEQIEGEMRNEK